MLGFLENLYSEDDNLCTVKGYGESFKRKHAEKQLNPFIPELSKAYTCTFART